MYEDYNTEGRDKRVCPHCGNEYRISEFISKHNRLVQKCSSCRQKASISARKNYRKNRRKIIKQTGSYQRDKQAHAAKMERARASRIAAIKAENPDETFLPIHGWGDLYEVSDFGRVLSLRAAKLMKPSSTWGYEIVTLSAGRDVQPLQVSRLVYFTFIDAIPDSLYIDHIDGNPSNNHLSNLRPLTHQQNLRASNKRVGRSGYRGVGWDSRRDKWQATISTLEGKQISLGYYDDPKEAARAWNAAAFDHGYLPEALNIIDEDECA